MTAHSSCSLLRVGIKRPLVLSPAAGRNLNLPPRAWLPAGQPAELRVGVLGGHRYGSLGLPGQTGSKLWPGDPSPGPLGRSSHSRRQARPPPDLPKGWCTERPWGAGRKSRDRGSTEAQPELGWPALDLPLDREPCGNAQWSEWVPGAHREDQPLGVQTKLIPGVSGDGFSFSVYGRSS